MNPVIALIDALAARSVACARVQGARLFDPAPQRAWRLLAVAAPADAQSAYLLGELYHLGRGVPQHAVEAARWFHRAATQGVVAAQYRLAQLFLSGLQRGVLDVHTPLFETPAQGLPDYAAALPWATRAAQAGSPEAQALLGYIHAAGPDALRDADLALDWYRKSAAQLHPPGQVGHAIGLILKGGGPNHAMALGEASEAAAAGLPIARFIMGLIAERGLTGPADDAAARAYYQQAAEDGFAPAQARLADFMLAGKGGPAHRLKGEVWLRRAALNGDTEAAFRLGAHYAVAADGPDDAQAANWLRLAAAQGDARAPIMLAQMCQQGRLHDSETPVHEWFETAAAAGDSTAAFNLAVCLAEGVSVPRDEARALYWLGQAAGTLPQAQYWAARMQADGRGGAVDEAAAARNFLVAAEAGLPEAQASLAELYLNGRGVPRDPAAALHWFRRAAEAGHSGAMYGLGRMLSGGHDVPAEPEAASYWLRQAEQAQGMTDVVL
jgi:TPR repeat protein